MAQPMNIDLLRGACMAHGVSIEARGYNDLRIALGGVLVDKMLGISTSSPPEPPVVTSTPAPAPAPNEGKKAKGTKRPCNNTADQESTKETKKPRKPSFWHAFIKTEKIKVKEGMPHLKGQQILGEIARRWKIQKLVNTASSPLLITDASSTSGDSSSDGDGAVEGLTSELLETSTTEEINNNLRIAGLAVHADPQVNATRLAAQMIEL